MKRHFVSVSQAVQRTLPRRSLCGRVMRRGDHVYNTSPRRKTAVNCEACLRLRWPETRERFLIRGGL